MKKLLAAIMCICLITSSIGISVSAANESDDNHTDETLISYLLKPIPYLLKPVFWAGSLIDSAAKATAYSIGMASPILIMILVNKFSELYKTHQARANCGTIDPVRDPILVINKLDSYLKNVKGQEKAKEKLRNFVINLVDERNKKLSGISKKKGANLIYFVGPSGVGKSLSAEILTKVITGNNSLPYIIEPSDIDKESKKSSVVEQLFGMRTKKINNSEYYELSPLLLQLKATPNMVVIINEYDKLQTKDLDEKLRTILDQGYVKVNGETIDCSHATFIITSNESLGSISKGAHEDDGTGSRTYVEHDKAFLNRIKFINFENLSFEQYKEIAQAPCADLQKNYLASYKIFVDFNDAIERIADLTEKLNQGARPIQDFVDKLNEKILTEVILKNSKDRNYEGKTYKVSYDESREDFVVNEIKKPVSESTQTGESVGANANEVNSNTISLQQTA